MHVYKYIHIYKYMHLQEELLAHMGILTDSARRIGAVNTITARLAVDGSRILVGDNTDWVAIHRLVEQVMCVCASVCVYACVCVCV